jgi:hypothetical protein
MIEHGIERCDGHMVRIGETRNAYRILTGKPLWKWLLGREDNTKENLRGR